MNGRRFLYFCIGVALKTAVVAVPAHAADRKIYEQVNRGVAAHHILPRYGALKRQAQALQADVHALCRVVSDESLVRARQSFHQAMEVWQGVQHIRFGPIEKDNRHSRIQFWPDRRDRVGKHLSKLIARADPKPLAPAVFAAGSVAVQGFPVLEILLFGKAGTVAGLRGPDGSGYRCKLIEAIAKNLAAVSASLESEWAGIADALGKVPPPNPVAGLGKRTGKDIASAIFNDFVTAFGFIKDLKFGGPMGVKSGRVRAYLAENGQSKRSLANVAANLAAMDDLYGAVTGALPRAWQKTPQQVFIRAQFQKLIGDVRSLGPSLVDILADKSRAGKLKILMFGISDLRDLVVGDLSETLDLTLGFNALDGD